MDGISLPPQSGPCWLCRQQTQKGPSQGHLPHAWRKYGPKGWVIDGPKPSLLTVHGCGILTSLAFTEGSMQYTEVSVISAWTWPNTQKAEIFSLQRLIPLTDGLSCIPCPGRMYFHSFQPSLFQGLSSWTELSAQQFMKPAPSKMNLVAMPTGKVVTHNNNC